MSNNFSEIANELSLGLNMPDVNGLLAKFESSASSFSAAEIASLVNIIEKSDGVPKPIISWLIDKISKDIISAGKVDTVACHNLRHLLFSCASDNGTIISAAEAEALFEIKNATLGGENAPDWKDFFSKAIANHLMAHNFDAIQEKVDKRDYGFHNYKFFNWVAELLGGYRNDYWGETHSETAINQDSKITASENAWLDNKINQDGEIDEYEKAVIEFIAANKN